MTFTKDSPDSPSSHSPFPSTSSSTGDRTASSFYSHSTGHRTNTDVIISESLRKQYPNFTLTVTPAPNCNLLSFASAGLCTLTPLSDSHSPLNASQHWRFWIPPPRRSAGSGYLRDIVIFGKYMVKWRQEPGLDEVEFLLYVIDGRDGTGPYPTVQNNYILYAPASKPAVDALISACSAWMMELHQEVLVFDGGFWQKSRELWESVQDSRWEDVILDPETKKSLINDVTTFFASREKYKQLQVAWKRGIIYYGPPGNGKTISIKAMMHMLSARGKEDGGPIPSLYVRSLTSFGGPEYSLRMIFGRARQEAPCYLIFEDLDSVVSDAVRSYFLNEVDGIKSNDGIFMVGSTNHLDRLDPGIAKRPSRFDRKYLFDNPNKEERVRYAEYWQGKLGKSGGDVEFPDEMCPAIAGITGGFSFAYMQEGFVASLLAIARRRGDVGGDDGEESEEVIVVEEGSDDDPEDDHPELDKYELWVEMKKQVKILREALGNEKGAKSVRERPL